MSKYSTNYAGMPGHPSGKMSNKLSWWFIGFVTIILATTQANAQSLTWYRDYDGDGMGKPSVSQVASSAPSGYVLNHLDCNDSLANAFNWTTVGSAGFSASAVAYTKIAKFDTSVYVVYRDGANSDKATVMKYNGTSWASLGSAGFSAGAVDYTDIAVDGSGTPYVVYKDAGNSNKATVMKYNGSSWVTVGIAGFSAGAVDYTAIAIDTADAPFVVYRDAANGNGVTVMKYNGSSWDTVGSPAITGSSVGYTDIAMHAGVPYIAFHDNTGSNSGISVMQYNGSSWAFIGARGSIGASYFSGAQDIKIALDDSGTPFVKYILQSYGAYVSKYNGSSWVNVGDPYGFGSGFFYSISEAGMAVDAVGTAYIFYNGEYGYSYQRKGIVQKASGNSWATVASGHFTASDISYPDMIVDEQGIPWVVYRDAGNGSKVTVVKMGRIVTMPGVPMLSAPASTVCSDSSITISLTGTLNDATQWKWYADSCGGTAIGTGTSITVSPTTSITYYARGEDNNCLPAPGSCGAYTIHVKTPTWYRDFDGDGLGDATASQVVCKPSGYVLNSMDCNDSSANNRLDWRVAGSTGFSAGAAAYTKIASFGSSVYVVYQDGANSNKATVMKYNGTGWTIVGTAGFSAGAVTYTDIAIDGSGTLYVVYKDGGNSDKATVMKYNGTSWTTVGSAGFSASSVDYTSIDVDAHGTPYVVYQAGTYGANGVTVMKYNGSSWVTVGNANITGNRANYPDITLKGEMPYIAFYDQTNSGVFSSNYGISVMKYNGSSWVFVGGQQSITNYSYGYENIGIAIDNSGTPFVKYITPIFPDLGNVKKFNGSSWVTVGAADFGNNGNNGIDAFGMALNAGGIPHIFYNDNGYSNSGVIVQKPNGSSWATVGSANFGASYIQYPDIIFDHKDMPWVVYCDAGNSNKVTVMTMRQPELGEPDVPKIAGKAIVYCGDTSGTALLIDSAFLNDATQWKWYTGSCGGTLIDSGESIIVSPSVTTTYYARGEGGCASLSGSCGSFTVTRAPRKWYADTDNDGWGDPTADSAVCAGIIVPGYVTNNFDCNDNDSNSTAWQFVDTAGFTNSSVSSTEIASAPNGTTYVAYRSGSSGYVAKYDGSGWVANLGNVQFALSSYFNIAVGDASVPYVVNSENVNGSTAVVVKRYNGITWVQVGPHVATGSYYSDIAMGKGNIPYVVCTENSRATVKKYDGSNWVTVGNAEFTKGYVSSDLHIALDAQDNPYILYSGYSPSGLYVMKYNGSTWDSLGTSLIPSTSFASYPGLAVDANGTPYVVNSDPYNSYKSMVVKYNGSSWDTLGGSAISAGSAYYNDIVIDGSGTPYVVYRDAAASNMALLRKFNGTSWDTVLGPATTGTANYTSVALDNNGLPVIAFGDQSQSNKLSVRTLGRVSTGNPVLNTLATTDATLCGGSTATLSIQSGILNDAREWQWYSGSCGGTAVGSGASVQVSPSVTTTYYARGEGSCIISPGSCDSIAITVPLRTWYADADGDGFGNAAVSTVSCAAPANYVGNALDCNDGQVHPASWTDVGSSFSTGTANYLHSAIDGNGTVYAVFQDGANSNKATVKKYNGSNWVTVGNAAFSPGEVRGTTIAIDGTGTPYVAYRDFANGEKASVMKFDGTSWVQVGNAGFTSAKAYENTIAIDKNNVPYIIHTDGNTNKANVMKYNGSSWVFVGGAGVSQGDAYYFDIVFDGSNTPYIAYKDVANNYKTSVMKYNGSNWVFVGNPGFSTGQTNGTSLVIDNNGTPYVAFPDNQNNYKGTVMKYNGTSWVSLGTAGDIIASPSLAMYGNTLYFAYRDGGQNDAIALSKYDGTSWSSVGTTVSQHGHSNDPTIAIDGLGKLYVIYTDTSSFIARAATIVPVTLGNADIPKLATVKNSIYCGNSTILSIDTGMLNDATQWKWYTSSCGGTLVDSGASIIVSPTVTTTYYARGEGGCATAGTCGSITITVTNHTWYADADGDGFGNPAIDSMSCAQPVGYVNNDYDCNDNAVNPPGWKHFGTPGFTAGYPENLTSAQDAAGTMYIAYADAGDNYKATVMKHDGSNWVYVGNAGFSIGTAREIKLVIDAAGTPYVGYKDGHIGNKATVMKYDGSNWVYVGNAGFTPGTVFYTELNIDNSGTPYILFRDGANANKASVMKYDGSNWVSVGASGFSVGSIESLQLEFDNNNTPYVAFSDYGLSGKAAVMKFSGNNWLNVGSAGVTLDLSVSNSLKIDASGTPYLAWVPNTDYDVSVMKYDGVHWVLVGPAGLTGGDARIISLAIDGTTLYLGHSNNTQYASAIKYNGSSWVSQGVASASFANDISVLINDGTPYLFYKDNTYGNKAVVSVPAPVSLGAPTTPVLATSDTILCGGTTATLSIQSGTLNDANQWHWYSSSCGGTPVGTGASIQVTPLSTTTYYARGEGSCLSSPGICDSIVIKAFANPVVTVDPRDSTVCNNSNASFSITATGDNSLTYQWQVNTGTGYANVTNTGLYSGAATNKLMLAGPTTIMSGYLYRCIVTNGCNTKDTSAAATFTIYPIPAVTPVTDVVACNAAPVSVNFSGTVGGTTYSWTNSNTSIGLAASGAGNIASFASVNNGTTPVTATVIVTPTANGCVGTNDTFTITVNPTPSVVATADQTLCNSSSVTAVNFSGGVSNTSYSWANNTTSVGLAGSGSGNIPSFTAVNNSSAPVTATVIVTPSANSCVGLKDTFTVTVNPTPNVVAIADQAACNGTSTSAVNFSGSVSGTSYTWTNNTTSVGLVASSSGNIPAFAAINNGSAPVTASVIVSTTANGCAGGKDTFTITANPIPNVVAAADQTLCNSSATTVVNFSGNVSGTSYNWTNNTVSTGLAASGAGNIASFNAINTTSVPVTATVIVTPNANSCSGSKDTFTITVNPTPNVMPTNDQTLCSGAFISPVNFTGNVTGTTYSWTNNTTSISLAASGIGNLPVFATVNSASTGRIARVIVTPSANSCVGIPDTFLITVNPIPNVAAVSNRTYCNGETTTALNFTGLVSGTTYNWANSMTSIGLAASGSGNIVPFVITNSTNAPSTATITITPSANGCTGSPSTVSITVNPTPVSNAVAPQDVCNGAKTNMIAFTGSQSNTTYNWTNTNTSIGLAASGSGNIISFPAVNNTTSPVIATITAIPVANGCIGASFNTTITVNPIPTIDLVSNQVLCNGILTSAATFNGSVAGTQYNWTNNKTSIGLPASGIGGIAPFIAKNTGVTPVTATITVIPEANNCYGQSRNFNIEVNPSPRLSSNVSPSVCAGSDFSYTPQSLSTNVSYTWNRAQVSGITPATASGTGNVTEILLNNTIAKIDTRYIYTLTAYGCKHDDTVVLSVNPVPAIPTIETKSLGSVCSNTLFQNFSAEHPQPPGIEYTWTANNAVVWSSGDDKKNSLINFVNAGKVVVKLTANVTGFSCTASDSFIVEVSSINTAEIPTVIYHNEHFICLDNTKEGYQWGYDNAATLDSVTLYGEKNQDYLNASPDFMNKYYWVITKDGECSQKTYFNAPSGIGGTMKKAVFDLKVYPNPTTDYADIEINGNITRDLEVRIMDMTGKSVRTVDLQNSKARIYVGDMPAGIYSVIGYYEGVRIAVAKLVKN